MRPVKLAVVGTITQDTIRSPNKKIKRSYGGILYNIIPLALLAPESLYISPVCNLGSNIYEKVISYLKRFKNINSRGITRVRGKNNHVFLHYDQKWDKKEILRNLVPEIEFSQIRPYLNSDLILINFISGFDISLESLKKVREKTRARIFMDVHSLVLGIKENGKRFFRIPDYWEEYLKIADIVQMNFKEMQILSADSLGSDIRLNKFAARILGLGPAILLATRGKEGALLYFKDKGKIVSYRTGSLRISDFIDPTGCGDVFSSGFILAYLRTGDPVLSVEFANFLAGMKSRFSGIEKCLDLILQND